MLMLREHAAEAPNCNQGKGLRERMHRLALDEEESEEHIPDTEKSMCEDLAESNSGTLKELKVEAGVSGYEEAHAQC